METYVATKEGVEWPSRVTNPDTGKKCKRILDAAECRKKYHWLRELGMDAYQAGKMRTWPWPWIHEWIAKHGQLGNPNVNQYGFQKRKPKTASTPGNSENRQEGLAEGSNYQESLYQSRLMDGEHHAVCELEASTTE